MLPPPSVARIATRASTSQHTAAVAIPFTQLTITGHSYRPPTADRLLNKPPEHFFTQPGREYISRKKSTRLPWCLASVPAPKIERNRELSQGRSPRITSPLYGISNCSTPGMDRTWLARPMTELEKICRLLMLQSERLVV